MSERPDARFLRVLNGLVTLIERDTVTNAGLWKEIPRTIALDFGTELVQKPAPIVAFMPYGNGQELEARPLGHGRTRASVTALLIARKVPAIPAIVDLWTDFRRCIRSNLNLAGIDPDGDPLLTSGTLQLGEFDYTVVDGEGVVEQTILVDFTWSTASP